MSKTRRKELVLDDRWKKKGGPHKEDENLPIVCPVCNGFGVVEKKQCEKCDGIGEIYE